MEHILKLEQVKKYYGGAAGNITKAVDGISMEVNKGEFTAIMGASGSGKTTFLKMIGGLLPPSSGFVPFKLYFHDRHRNRRTHYCQSSGYYKNQRKRLCLIPTKESGIYLSGL